MLNSLIYSNRATPYRAKSGLVQWPVFRPSWGKRLEFGLKVRNVL